MLIDDLRELNIHLGPAKIRDAVVFRINERADDFGISHVRDELEPLPSLPPYNNTVIHFDGFCMWYLMEDVSLKDGDAYVVMGSLFSAEVYKEAYSYNKTPRVVFLSYIDKSSYRCIGMNIYYPHTKRLEYGHGEVAAESEKAELMGNNYKYLQAFLLILSCKNIRTDLEEPDEKIQKKRASNGKLPLVSSYVLKIQNIYHTARTQLKKDYGPTGCISAEGICANTRPRLLYSAKLSAGFGFRRTCGEIKTKGLL